MTTNNFYYALSLLEELYGITLQEDKFEEIALIAWNKIGNKRCKVYKYTACLDLCERKVELPCNCDIIEAVTTDFEDFLHVSNTDSMELPGSYLTEEFIEYYKAFKSHLYLPGKFIPYERVGNTLYFNQYYPKVNILYKGTVLDENGLPELNDKEALAIATFCAYTTKFKEGLRTNNRNSIELSNMLKAQWLIECDQARVPEDMSQNEWDEILDAKQSWDRKIYTRSYKPIR